MQDHEKYLKLASFYLDGELTENQREDYIHHLKDCDICREEIELIKSYQTEIKDPIETQITPEINTAIMKYAEEAQNRKGFFERIFDSFDFKLNVAVSTATIIIGLFSGIIFFKFHHNTTQIDSYTMNGTELYNTVFPGSIAESFILMEEQND